MRFAATVAYDGTAYAGFQRQRNAPSVQEEIERALEALAERQVRVIGAGRTDSGVHATGQVIAFDLDWRHTAADLRAALNNHLPEDVAAKEVWRAADEFHPRHDAASRTYLYRVVISATRDPLRQRYAWIVDRRLDVDRMNEAAATLIGTHDFSSFGLPPKGENATREASRAVWESVAPDELWFTITANAFLFRMARSIVGTLVRVGQGRMTADEFYAILAARQRGLATLAPACGLTLAEVTYPSSRG